MTPPVLADIAAAASIALAAQTVVTGGAWEKLAETAPLTAVLVAGLWLVFAAYRNLAALMLQALQENREAMTQLRDAVSTLKDAVRHLEEKTSRSSTR